MRTLHKELNYFTPAIALERYFPSQRRRLARMFFLALGVVGSLGYIFLEVGGAKLLPPTFSDLYLSDPDIYLGSACIGVAMLAVLYLLSFFYNTFYFRTIRSQELQPSKPQTGLTFEGASVLAAAPDDITRSFLESDYGRHLLMRTGVTRPAIGAFLADENRIPLTLESLQIPANEALTAGEVALQLYSKDSGLLDLLKSFGVTTEIYTSANQWINRRIMHQKRRARWWSKDNLRRRRKIGRGLSFGVAYELNRFAKSLYASSVFSVFARTEGFASDIVKKIEATLVRSHADNCILVGEPGVGKSDIIIEVSRRIMDGQSSPELVDAQVVLFDQEAFVATYNTKQTFEPAFIRLLAQAEQAGNIILVFENLSRFLESVDALGSNAAELLDRFASSTQLHVLATDIPEGYYHYVEQHPQLLQKFNSLYINDPTHKSVLRVLENEAVAHEARYEVFFTYPAIMAIASGADRYLVDGAMPERAVTLLSEVVATAHRDRKVLITKEMVSAYIGLKTGIPVGQVTDDERQQLLNLENILHQRVIGQNRAITAVSGAMRRARAGITSGERPLGSFLFLGSTGVGKTETAKALAHTFFGSDEKMIRIDMSEFNTEDALDRMVGATGSSGVLATKLREHPYGVLLLDEFEKSSPKIHNLFLQILDEGQFTDGKGKRVNAHNVIIVATSNAGSEKIWEMAEAGKNPADAKDEIISTIISDGIFKPELINRFDATIIFETLHGNQQSEIAHQLLRELQTRIAEHGYQLQITDELIEYVAKKGFDPEFGARPMRRVIQDDIEEKAARKIISGKLKAGDVIMFGPSDLVI